MVLSDPVRQFTDIGNFMKVELGGGMWLLQESVEEQGGDWRQNLESYGYENSPGVHVAQAPSPPAPPWEAIESAGLRQSRQVCLELQGMQDCSHLLVVIGSASVGRLNTRILLVHVGRKKQTHEVQM